MMREFFQEGDLISVSPASCSHIASVVVGRFRRNEDVVEHSRKKGVKLQ